MASSNFPNKKATSLVNACRVPIPAGVPIQLYITWAFKVVACESATSVASRVKIDVDELELCSSDSGVDT